MTDISRAAHVVPGRLGVSAHLDGDALRLELTPRPEVLHHGAVRASVLAYVIDAVAGISVDTDPDHWTLTTDLSVRMRPVPAPARAAAPTPVVRRGRRSVTCTVELTDGGGDLV